VDPAPIVRLLTSLNNHEVDALLITSQAQVDNLFGVARDYSRQPDLKDVAIGAQGPVAEAALERHGLHAAFHPAHGHMGALVLAAAEYFDEAFARSERASVGAGRAPTSERANTRTNSPQGAELS
jgi:uroporphyrinogen-III synthase